jgi:hypothetical protein
MEQTEGPEEEPNETVTETNETLQDLCDMDIYVNDYIVVELTSLKGTKKNYVRKVVGSEPYRCSFLKSSTKAKNTFVFPDVPDESDIDEKEVILKLPPPTILRRGGVKFDGNLIEKYHL